MKAECVISLTCVCWFALTQRLC